MKTIHCIYLPVLTGDTKKESTANYLICMEMNISSLIILITFFSLKKERICLTQDRKPHLEDKERVMNLQQGHIIMQ